MMEVHKHYGVESSCVLPLTTAYRRLGSLSFGARFPNAYSSNEIRYLCLVAEQVALAVDNALREEERSKKLTGSKLDTLLSQGYSMDPDPLPFSANWVSGVFFWEWADTAVPYNSSSGSVWEEVNTDMQSQP